MKTHPILCPTDFSETASHALGYAIEMASYYRVDLHLLHVISLPYGVYSAGSLEDNCLEMERELQIIAAENMRKLMAEIHEQMPAGLFAHNNIRSGDVVEQILKEANERESGMIVIASHGYQGLSHLLNSNIAETVANDAKCPVLVVK